MADTFYNAFYWRLMNGSHALASGAYKCMLVTSSYVVNPDLHEDRADITNEVTGTGYTAGGVTLTGKTTAVDNANDRGIWDFDDPQWAASTITARAGIIYLSTGVAANDFLVAYIDLGSDRTSTAGTFRLALDGVGFMAIGA